MVDERRVRLLLQRVSEGAGYLQSRSSGDRATIRGDVDRLAALKYFFVTTIEGCLDVAQHLCASQGWGPPASNADAVRLLARHGVLQAPLAERVALAVGFRNVLVHGYADVDDDQVVSNLDDIDDLAEYVRQVSTWIREGADGV